MKIFCSSIFVMIAFLSLSGCGIHLVRSYPDSPIEAGDHATLTFISDTLEGSYGYLGLIRRLRLNVYEMQPEDKSGQLEPMDYLGTIYITKDENSNTISIPAGKILGLEAQYYKIFLNVYTDCTSQCLLTPERGASYILKYTLGDKKCWINLSKVGMNEPLATESAEKISEEREQNKKTLEGKIRVTPKKEMQNERDSALTE